jgi:hypothetical protein
MHFFCRKQFSRRMLLKQVCTALKSDREHVRVVQPASTIVQKFEDSYPSQRTCSLME